MTTPGSVRDRLLSLVAAHRCSGCRRLVSSEVCLREEVTGPRADASASQPALAEVLDQADVASHFTIHSDSGWEGLPNTVPEPSGLTFGERDRRLTAATDAAGQDADVDPLLVTDDDDFLENLRSPEVALYVRVFPITSGELLIALHECGAVTYDELEAVLVAEDARLDKDSLMQARKRARKEDALNRMAARLGRRTAT
jgi:hypothetical protein